MIDTRGTLGKNSRRPDLELSNAKIKRLSFAGLLAGLALITVGCSRTERWNVLLVTFDTTRADHIGSYGHPRARTPNLDALAAEGVRFARAYSAIPLTTPSHSTIFTGKYPIAHGVRDNGMFVLSDRQETLAEILKARGWATAAAIGSFPLTRRFGTDQGFDFYDDDITQQFENVLGHRTLPKASLFFDERPAGRVNEALFPWIEEHHDQPFFVWAHYFDPHHPLAPPPPYDQLFADDPYSGEIAYSDDSFGKLVDRLKELGVYDRTLIVFASDHGEGLGEHRELTHSMLLYNSTLHVPLIIKVPGARAGAVVEKPVGTVDILPTVLEALRIPAPEGVQGQSRYKDLISESSEESAESSVLYAETLSPRLGYQWGELRALYDDGHKYVFGPRPELYDLEADPKELRDLMEAEPETAKRLHRKLSRFLEDNAAPDLDAAVEVDDETRKKLMALGYMTGAAGSETIEEELRPGGVAPQDRIGDISDFSLVKQLLFSRQALPARELVLGLVERDPKNPIYLELLASANLQLGRLDEALETLERLRAEDATGTISGKLLLQLGSVYFYRGEYDRAEELLRESTALDPGAIGHYLLANVYSARGQRSEERESLLAALEADPTYAPARVDLAIRAAQAGDRQAAEAAFRQAMSDQPYFPKTFYNYGAFLAEAGELGRALESFHRAVNLEPRYVQAYVAMVQLYLALGEPEEAKRQYENLALRAPSSPETERARALIEEAS